MTRTERQQFIANRFKDEIIETHKPDIIRGGALEPAHSSKVTTWDVVAVMVGIFFILVAAHGLGWIKVVNTWL